MSIPKGLKPVLLTKDGFNAFYDRVTPKINHLPITDNVRISLNEEFGQIYCYSFTETKGLTKTHFGDTITISDAETKLINLLKARYCGLELCRIEDDI